MIRRIITVLTVAVILCSAAAGKAHAAGFQIGATYWHAWWDPMFKDWMLRSSNAPFPRMVRDYSFEPASLAGPVIGINFNDRVNLTAVFVTGKYRLRASLVEFNPIIGGLTPSHQDTGVDKYDLDTALNITMNRYVKILVGLKYQNYSYTKASLLNIDTGTGTFLYTEDKVSYNGISAGFGAGFTFGIYKNLFGIWSLSARYQLPIITVRVKQFLGTGGSIMPSKETVSPWYNSVGANSVFSLAYLMEDLSTTLSLGFRYQYLYTFGKDTEYVFLSGRSDHFYGVIISAVYAYQAPEKEPVLEEETK